MRFDWAKLNRQQVGAYSEYFVKMELTMYGFEVYTTEVDDRGIDFVTRYDGGPFISVQVKSIRKGTNYVFMQKDKFELDENLYLALVILTQDAEPELYLIPSLAWKVTSSLFVDRDYEGLKSKPEYGLGLTKQNMDLLDTYQFDRSVEKLLTISASPE
jgi:hypothetical protein